MPGLFLAQQSVLLRSHGLFFFLFLRGAVTEFQRRPSCRARQLLWLPETSRTISSNQRPGNGCETRAYSSFFFYFLFPLFLFCLFFLFLSLTLQMKFLSRVFFFSAFDDSNFSRPKLGIFEVSSLFVNVNENNDGYQIGETKQVAAS